MLARLKALGGPGSKSATSKKKPGIEHFLLLLMMGAFAGHILHGLPKATDILPRMVYEYSLGISYEDQTSDLHFSVFLPNNSERQQILEESTESGSLRQSLFHSSDGLRSHWSGIAGNGRVNYAATIATQSYRVHLNKDMELQQVDENTWGEYLNEALKTSLGRNELDTIWKNIKPTDSRLVVPVLEAIFEFSSAYQVSEIRGTVANEATQRSRIFRDLARMQGIPSRLVGGIILEPGKDQRAHHWVEINLDNQWVPFDPDRKLFAQLPSYYLELYYGDMEQTSHSSGTQIQLKQAINTAKIAPVIYPALLSSSTEVGGNIINLAEILVALQIPEGMVGMFLLFPVCALFITFLRNMVGIKSFGVFVPMLIGASCAIVGLWVGLMCFTLILLVAILAHHALAPLKLLKVPRLAAVLTIINLASFGMLASLNEMVNMSFGMLALFPLVIISFVADKLHELSEDDQWQELLITCLGTLASIILCFGVLQSTLLQAIFALYPELFLLIIVIQISLGRWTGIRISELIRFSSLITQSQEVLGINARNRKLVYEVNGRTELRLAADKLESKERLQQHRIPVPETIARFERFSDIEGLENILEGLNDFVIKPNRGSQGKGIAVIDKRIGDQFITAGGKTLELQDLKNLIAEIINGQYSQIGDADIAFIEPLIRQHQDITDVAPHGLADIRLILTNNQVQSAMLRLPTKKSGGKANLHQGAIGAAIDLKTGQLTRSTFKGRPIKLHPDTQKPIESVVIPHWDQVMKIGIDCLKAVPLGYMGADICIDQHRGPLVLEVNGRPGLEIQNVQNQGFKRLLLDQIAKPGFETGIYPAQLAHRA
jgi:alpha-L-glutamate ligase-like protein